MPSDRPSLPHVLGLSARALLIQLVLGTPFGLADFAVVLEKTGQPAIAWVVAYAFGCYRSVGLPFLVGGALIGAIGRQGRLWAVVLSGLPTALVAGSYLSGILGLGTGRALGGMLALWLLGTMVGMVGYGLGRIFERFRKRKQVEPWS